MTNVDFLPPGYRARYRRRGMPWSVFAVAGLVFGGILFAGISQYVYGTVVDARLDAAAKRKAAVDADLARLDDLRRQRERFESQVRRTFLTHRRPELSDFLVELGTSLPTSCRLLEIARAEGIRSTDPTIISGPVRGRAAPAAAETGAAAVDRDRERLRNSDTFAGRETWTATGVSTDVSTLHEFVETLERTNEGVSARLTSFEADRGQANTIRFVVTIERVRGAGGGTGS